MPRLPALSPAVVDAVTAVGLEIRNARQGRGWTKAELAERAGITPKTLRTVEEGSPGVAMGIVFEVALLVGLDLLGRPEDAMPALVERGRERLSMAPQRVHRTRTRPRKSF